MAPQLWGAWGAEAEVLSAVLIGTTVVVCLLRGLPVVVEFVATARALHPGGAPGGRR